MNSSLTYRSGIKDVLPTVFGYIGVGMAFGIVANTNHLSILAVFFMSYWYTRALFNLLFRPCF